MECPICEPFLTYYFIHLYMYLSVSRFNNVYNKNVGQVQQTLSNKNQVNHSLLEDPRLESQITEAGSILNQRISRFLVLTS